MPDIASNKPETCGVGFQCLNNWFTNFHHYYMNTL
jgi:hypothetical protein